MSFREFDPSKLKKKLEPFKHDYIVQKANHQFSRSNLSAWANGHWKPSQSNLIALLSALECDFDEISTPVKIPAAVEISAV